MTYAQLRQDLMKHPFAPSNPPISQEDFEDFKFKVLCMGEFETEEEGYNLLLEHPVSKLPILACSIDFEFVEDAT